MIIGASNPTRAFGTLLRLVDQAEATPAVIVTALGHGRSYGMTSTVLVRTLPSIVHCGLWDALRRRPPLPTRAVVTDIGNDILYHAPVPQIVEWVAEVLLRLRRLGAEIVLTRLPVSHLDRLSTARFYFFRSLFMPLCRLSRDEVVRRAIDLDTEVARLGAEFATRVVMPRTDWYGLDPLHIRRRDIDRAWHEIMDLGNVEMASLAKPSCVRCRWELLTPHERRLFGIEQRATQPVWRLPSGTQVSCY